ncbi:MAG: DUF362 domain-containing protein [Kiritimatiellia bacterium]|nr:DUF362 domain-containing protein [Kiritimatiellia bacterium]
MSVVVQAKFTQYRQSIAAALDTLGADKQLPSKGLIIIKPNLTNSSPPPVTTSVEMVEAIYDYCRQNTGCEIAIGEGCGFGKTSDVFRANGYERLAHRKGIKLIDFNSEPAEISFNSRAAHWKKLHLPVIVRNAFLISVPVLKDHSFTTTTISMKNMFGLVPAPFYKGNWNKSALHHPSTHRSVVDICLHKKPDLCVVDAVVALTGMHLSGKSKKLGVILAGFDPVAVDSVGSRLLGHDPRRIDYLCRADGLLGDLRDINVVNV